MKNEIVHDLDGVGLDKYDLLLLKAFAEIITEHNLSLKYDMFNSWFVNSKTGQPTPSGIVTDLMGTKLEEYYDNS